MGFQFFFEFVFWFCFKSVVQSFFFLVTVFGVLLCFIDPRVRKIRNEASSCPGIFSRTLRFYYVANFFWF